jgi:hypothetical protein
MENSKNYCVVVEGNYFDEDEAENALREPFIEEWAEQAGKFRIHNFDDIEVVSGISLGDLVVSMVEDEVFKISCDNSGRHLTQDKAKKLASSIERQAMFEEVRVEPV